MKIHKLLAQWAKRIHYYALLPLGFFYLAMDEKSNLKLMKAKKIYKQADRFFRKERNQDKIRPKFFTAVINIKSHLKTYMPNANEHYMVCEMLRRVKKKQYEPEYDAISWLLKDEHIRQHAYYPFRSDESHGCITVKLTIVERNHQTKDIYFSMDTFECHNWMPMYALHNRTHHLVDLPF